MKKIVLILIAIFFVIVAYSFFVEPNRLDLNKYVIQDSQLKGVKIVFASDFHIKTYGQKRLDKIVDMINTENPDLVLSVGDFVCGHMHYSTMPIEDIAKTLGKVKAKYGFYTTLGNHDAWYGNDEVQKALEQNRIKVLGNENIKLNVNGKTLYIAGVEDLMTGKPNVYEALNNTKRPVIMLTHTPDMFPKVPDDVNLTLAGHTHGGQIRIPFLGPIFTASSHRDKYSKGLIEENGKKMIVTTGIGVSILPIRFNCPPEIVVIEFE